MKKLICIAIFLLALSAEGVLARGEADCPCNDPPVFKCCGSMTCDTWSNNATYVMGGSCSPKKNYYCCVNGGPFVSTREGAEPIESFDVQFVHGNEPIDALTPNGVQVRMIINGQQVPGKVGHGRIVDGYLEMNSGDRYLMLAGDLILVYGANDD